MNCRKNLIDKISNFLSGNLVRVNSDEEIKLIISTVSDFYFPNFDIAKELSIAHEIGEGKVVYIAMGKTCNMYLIALFFDDIYESLPTNEGDISWGYAYVCNTAIPKYSEYGGVNIKKVKEHYIYY